jgi:hypothetical protein
LLWLSHSLWRRHQLPWLLLEAGPAQHGPTLGWLEGNRGGGATLRTGGPGLRAHTRAAAGALRLALLAVLGVVLELFVVEEKLLAGGENELSAAIDALQNSIGKFHGRIPQDGKHIEIGHDLEQLAGPVSLSSCFDHNKGRAAKNSAAKITFTPVNGELSLHYHAACVFSDQF